MPLFHLNTSENLKISLPLCFLSLSLSPFFLICLIALMVDQKKISYCQRSHPSLSQSNYKPGYFLPSAKHIAAWYCMTSFSYLFYLKITVKSTLMLQWNCLGNFSKTSLLKLSLWKTSLWLEFEIKSPNWQSVWTIRRKSGRTSNGKVNRIAAVTIIPFKHTLYYINVLVISILLSWLYIHLSHFSIKFITTTLQSQTS